MDKETVQLYEAQLLQVNTILTTTNDDLQKNELIALKKNIEELLSLNDTESSIKENNFNDEYALLMKEIGEERLNVSEIENVEGMKCQAPHKHKWQENVIYHNAMICSIINETQVRVLFTNPTHEEMLPCPYFFNYSNCKFSDDKCRFSHGEIVSYCNLKKYIEPKFDNLVIGSVVLAKESDNLWYRAIVRKLYDDKCFVRFELNRNDVELNLENILPLTSNEGEIEVQNCDDEFNNNEDIINMSLMITPTNEPIGDWQKYTKGFGLKMMEKMGYIVGTGLGKLSSGRIEPVSAVILPTGKSLDYCMELREKAGGDKDLFSVERKLKKNKKRQELLNKRIYENERKKIDVFHFINETLHITNNKPKQNFKKIQNKTDRDLNTENVKNTENIKRIEKDLFQIKESLNRNNDLNSQIHKNLKIKMINKETELKLLLKESKLITNELKLRSNKKKMTTF